MRSAVREKLATGTTISEISTLACAWMISETVETTEKKIVRVRARISAVMDNTVVNPSTLMI